MREAARIAARAHVRAMQFCRPGLKEYEVMAELLHEFRRHNADISYHPIVGGGLYGIGVFLAMTFVVIPLSRIGYQPFPPLPLAAVSLAVHILAFGVPLAATASWMLKPTATPSSRRGTP